MNNIIQINEYQSIFLISSMFKTNLIYFLFNGIQGWFGICIRTTVFSILFILTIIYGYLTPDAGQLIEQFKKRFSNR